MKVCPCCGHADALCWHSYRWISDIDFSRFEDFKEDYPQFKDIQVNEILEDSSCYYRRSNKKNQGLFVFRWSKLLGKEYYKMRDFERYKKPIKGKQIKLIF